MKMHIVEQKQACCFQERHELS